MGCEQASQGLDEVLGSGLAAKGRDEEPVDIVILVLWPEASPEGFLPALAETCRAVREPQALRRLRAATSAEEVAALLDRYGRPAAPDRAEST